MHRFLERYHRTLGKQAFEGGFVVQISGASANAGRMELLGTRSGGSKLSDWIVAAIAGRSFLELIGGGRHWQEALLLCC